jgi:hypothetical protein
LILLRKEELGLVTAATLVSLPLVSLHWGGETKHTRDTGPPCTTSTNLCCCSRDDDSWDAPPLPSIFRRSFTIAIARIRCRYSSGAVPLLHAAAAAAADAAAASVVLVLVLVLVVLVVISATP